MSSLPDGSVVVSVAGQMKYMSGRELLYSFPAHTQTNNWPMFPRNFVRGYSWALYTLRLICKRSYKFRQASDFWYLTGFDEPDAAVILEKQPSSPRGYYMRLFSAGTDPAKEKWDGARTAPDDVVEHFGADEAEPIAAFPAALRSLTASASTVYLDVPNHSRRSRAPSPKTLLKVRRAQSLCLYP